MHICYFLIFSLNNRKRPTVSAPNKKIAFGYYEMTII